MNNGDIKIKPMLVSDVEAASWSGGIRHLEYMREAIQRTSEGAVDFLGCWYEDRLIGYGGIDYKKSPGSGYMWMLTVDPSFQSKGIGTRLIKALEEAVLSRGVNTVRLSVETNNPRAKKLYEKLEYEVIGKTEESWEQSNDKGDIEIYHTHCDVMEKVLN